MMEQVSTEYERVEILDEVSPPLSKPQQHVEYRPAFVTSRILRKGEFFGKSFTDWIVRVINKITLGKADMVQRLFCFILVGGLGSIVNLLCFSLLYHFLMQSAVEMVAYFLAFVIATEVSILHNFVLNDWITFRHLRGHNRYWFVRCVRFHVTSAGGALVTLGISFAFFHVLHVPLLFSQGIALVAATLFNFTFHHMFTYGHKGL